MLKTKSKHHFDKDSVLIDLIRIIENITDEWEMGFGEKIGPATYLVADLDFKSIKVAHLAALIEEHFKNDQLPFQKLIMPAGRPVDDLRVIDVADFLYVHLNQG